MSASPRKSYTIQEKCKALDLLEEGISVAEVAREFQTSRKSIRDWRHSKDDLLRASREAQLSGASRKRLPGAGKKPTKGIKTP